jgi:membrane protease YdiL (CAAX protease family)
MIERELYPNFKQSLWLLFLLFVLQIVFVIAGEILFSIFKNNLGVTPIFLSAVNLISFGLIIVYVHKKTKQKWSDIFQFFQFRYIIIFPLIPLLIGLGVMASEANNLLRYLMPAPEFILNLMTNLTSSGVSSIILLGVIAPLTEEVLFRGIILKGFIKRYSLGKAIVLSAILFSLFHLNPYQFFSGLVMGLFLGFLYIKSRSIIPCIIAHSIYNVHGIIITSLITIDIPGYSTPSTFTKVQFQPMWFDLSGLAFLLIGFLFLWKVLNLTSINAEPINAADG